MRKIIFTTILVFLFFLIEFYLFKTGGRWLMPNLLLLIVIYLNLVFGIRYSIFAAVIAGLLKDSFSVGVFGFNIFVFVLCAYITTILKRYLHYVASRQTRLFLVFLILLVHVTVSCFLHLMVEKVNIVH